MRGQTFFSCALVAFTTSVYAAPLDGRTDALDVRQPYVIAGKEYAKVGTVDVGKEYFQVAARQDAGDDDDNTPDDPNA